MSFRRDGQQIEEPHQWESLDRSSRSELRGVKRGRARPEWISYIRELRRSEAPSKRTFHKTHTRAPQRSHHLSTCSPDSHDGETAINRETALVASILNALEEKVTLKREQRCVKEKPNPIHSRSLRLEPGWARRGVGIQFNVIMKFYTKASDLPDTPLRKRNEKFVIEQLKAKSGGF